LFEDRLIVELSHPAIIKNGMFSSNYVTYRVTTKPYDWVVERRYSDFAWLRDALYQEYPLTCIPPMAEKRVHGQFEPSF